MTIIYITGNNTTRCGVTFQNNGCVKVQKFEDISNDKNIIYTINPLETFLGKSKSCAMTALSGTFNKKPFDGSTILVKISEENGKHKFVCFSGDLVCSFMTTDNKYEYISNMGNNLCPYSVATGEKKLLFVGSEF